MAEELFQYNEIFEVILGKDSHLTSQPTQLPTVAKKTPPQSVARPRSAHKSNIANGECCSKHYRSARSTAYNCCTVSQRRYVLYTLFCSFFKALILFLLQYCPLLAQFNTRYHTVTNRTYLLYNATALHLSAVANFGGLWFVLYETVEGGCTVHVNFNLPTSFILLIIVHTSVLIYRFWHAFIYSFSTFLPLIIMHCYEVLYISKEEISSSKAYR